MSAHAGPYLILAFLWACTFAGIASAEWSAWRKRVESRCASAEVRS